MSTLDVCCGAPYSVMNRRLPASLRIMAAIAWVLWSALSGTCVGAQNRAEDKPVAAPQAAPMINFRERPHYPTEPQRLRRTVQIDGVLSDGEWDSFYTITEGPIHGTVYCNWDDNFLYLAARTDQPATVLFDLDMGGDGWLRGADNLELVVGGGMDGGTPALVAHLLDAANSKDTPSWNDKAVDVKSILAVSKIVNGAQILEIAIPKNTASLILRPGVTIGLRAEFLPLGPAAAYMPTQPFEPHLLLDATLVAVRVQAAAGISPKLTLSDYKCVPGQKLFATLKLRNQTDSLVSLRSVLWTGQGSAVNAVDTRREVAAPPVPPQKTLELKYNTKLPDNLAIGSYTLLVAVELENGKQVQSSVSFAIVEPVQVQIFSEPEPVAIVGQTRLVVSVDVYSAVPDHLRGDVELTRIPDGWQLEGSKKRGLYIDREDARRATRFTFKLPSTTPAGDFPLEATVTWHGRAWKMRYVAHVQRTEPPAAKPVDKTP